MGAGKVEWAEADRPIVSPDIRMRCAPLLEGAQYRKVVAGTDAEACTFGALDPVAKWATAVPLVLVVTLTVLPVAWSRSVTATPGTPRPVRVRTDAVACTVDPGVTDFGTDTLSRHADPVA